MCRYCNMIPDIHDWGETNITYSTEEDICDGKYEGYKIVYNNDYVTALHMIMWWILLRIFAKQWRSNI